MLENNFQYVVEYDYDQVYSCESYGCDEEGICRCSSIKNAHVTYIDMVKLANYFYEELFDSKSKQGKRNSILSNLFYGGDIIDKYCINRILTINKLYDAKKWNVKVNSGYYGDEIDDIIIIDKFNDICKYCKNVIEFETLSEKIKYVLQLEYGYLLENLKNSHFELIDIKKSDIDFSSLNQKHINIIKKSVSDGKLYYYNNTNYNLFRGVVKKSGDKYKIVDGFHRIISIEDDKEFKVFLNM